MSKDFVKPLKWGVWFLAAHTVLVPVLMVLKQGYSESGLFFHEVGYYMDYPLSRFFQSHKAQSIFLMPVAEWLDAHFPTPLLARMLVYVVLGGALYFLGGCLIGLLYSRYIRKRKLN